MGKTGQMLLHRERLAGWAFCAVALALAALPFSVSAAPSAVSDLVRRQDATPTDTTTTASSTATDCSFSKFTLDCGQTFIDKLKSPVVIAIIVGAVIIICCGVSIICCCVKSLCCFAVKTTGKIAGKAVSATAKGIGRAATAGSRGNDDDYQPAARNAKPKEDWEKRRLRPPSMATTQLHRERIYGDEERAAVTGMATVARNAPSTAASGGASGGGGGRSVDNYDRVQSRPERGIERAAAGSGAGSGPAPLPAGYRKPQKYPLDDDPPQRGRTPPPRGRTPPGMRYPPPQPPPMQMQPAVAIPPPQMAMVPPPQPVGYYGGMAPPVVPIQPVPPQWGSGGLYGPPSGMQPMPYPPYVPGMYGGPPQATPPFGPSPYYPPPPPAQPPEPVGAYSPPQEPSVPLLNDFNNPDADFEERRSVGAGRGGDDDYDADDGFATKPRGALAEGAGNIELWAERQRIITERELARKTPTSGSGGPRSAAGDSDGEGDGEGSRYGGSNSGGGGGQARRVASERNQHPRSPSASRPMRRLEANDRVADDPAAGAAGEDVGRDEQAVTSPRSASSTGSRRPLRAGEDSPASAVGARYAPQRSRPSGDDYGDRPSPRERPDRSRPPGDDYNDRSGRSRGDDRNARPATRDRSRPPPKASAGSYDEDDERSSRRNYGPREDGVGGGGGGGGGYAPRDKSRVLGPPPEREGAGDRDIVGRYYDQSRRYDGDGQPGRYRDGERDGAGRYRDGAGDGGDRYRR